jgi:hypothetical protein
MLPYIIGSFLLIAVWFVWFIVSAITGEKGRLGDIPFVLLLWGGVGILHFIPQHDLSVTEKGFTEISFFSKKDFLFEDIEIMSINVFSKRAFSVSTTIKSFWIAYTKANYAALKEIIPLVKYSKISVPELEKKVKKAFFAPA